jgi:metal-sulfur cluster biosynthetic enzyme
MITVEDKIRDALKKVVDPELGVSIVDLGLIYDVRYEKGEAEVEMTLTSPGCPLAPIIDKKIKSALSDIPEIKHLVVEIVWDPPWSRELMSAELRVELGLD